MSPKKRAISKGEDRLPITYLVGDMLVFGGSRSSPGSLKGKEYYQNKRFVMLLLVVTAGKGGAFQLKRTDSSLWPLKAWYFIDKSADSFILLVAPTQVTYYSEMPKYHDRVPKTSETERTGGDFLEMDMWVHLARSFFWIPTQYPP